MKFRVQSSEFMLGLDSAHINTWVRGEEITSYKSHSVQLILTYWFIVIFFQILNCCERSNLLQVLNICLVLRNQNPPKCYTNIYNIASRIIVWELNNSCSTYISSYWTVSIFSFLSKMFEWLYKTKSTKATGTRNSIHHSTQKRNGPWIWVC